MPRSRLRPLVPLLVTVLLAAAEPVDQLRAIFAAQSALEARHDALLRALPGERHRLLLELPGLLLDQTVTVELRRLGSTWLPGRAWCVALSDAVHPVTVLDLELAGSGRQQRLTGRLRIDFERGPGWSNDMVAEMKLAAFAGFPGVVSCDGRVFGEQVEGQYAVDFPPLPTDSEEAARIQRPDRPFAKGRPDLRGRWWAPVGALPPRRATMPSHWTDEELPGLYRQACYLELIAERHWQAIRTATAMADAGLDHDRAHAACRAWLPARADLQAAGKQADRKPPKAPRAPGPQRRGGGGDDLDLDDLDEELAAMGGGAAAAFDAQQTAQAEATIAAIAARLARMRELATAAPSPRPLSVQRDSARVADPDFGPWYGEERLPVDGRRNVLPDGVGGDGAQRWPCVAAWRLLGPAVPSGFAVDTPLLPELVVQGEERFHVERAALQEGGNYKGAEHLAWRDIAPERSFGYCVPPNWSSANRVYRNCPRAITGRHSGIEYSRCYAHTVVQAPRDCELWAAVGVVQRGKLWVNDVLVWTGPSELDQEALEHVALLRLPLRAGANELLLRCDVAYASPSFWLRICTQGRPAEVAQVTARQQAITADRARLPAASARGWRDDGTGVSEGATPPLAWDLKRGINVAWQTPLRYWSNATPVPAGDRLYVCIEPDTLVCLAAADGAVLWERQCSVIELLPEAQRAEGRRLREAWWAARAARDAVPAAVLRPHKWIGKTRWYWDEDDGGEIDERAGASAALLTLLDERDTLQTAPDPEAVQDQLTRVLEQIEKEKAKGGNAETRAAQQLEERVRAAERAWLAFLGEHSRVKGLDGYWYDYDGWAFATPVSDGEHVWWKNGMGVAACFTRDGEQRWMVRTGGGASGSPTIPSPLLHDGLLILKLPWYGKPADRRAKGVRLLALDAATGEQRWEAVDLPDSGWNASTPALLTLSDGEQRLPVLVTGGGSVVRATDGAVLVRDLGVQTADASPAVWEDRVVFCRPNLVAVRLILQDRDTVGFKREWCVRREGATYGGVICVDGRVYARGGRSPRKGPGEASSNLRLFDLRSGALLDRSHLFRKGGNGWSLHAATAGQVLLTGGDGLFSSCHPRSPSDCIVATRGERPLILARNVIDRSYAAPAPDGERLYLRGYTGVSCIAYTGAEGRAWELRTVVRTLLDGLPSCPRHAVEVLEPETGGARLPEQASNALLDDGYGPGAWMLAMGSDPVAVEPGDWRSLDRGSFPVSGAPRWTHDPANFSDIHRDRRMHDVGTALGGAGGRILLATRLELHRDDRPATWRLDWGPGVVGAWIGGSPVPDGSRVHIARSTTLCLAIEVPADGPFWVGPRFWRSDDPAVEAARVAEALAAARPWLDRLLAEQPGSVDADLVRRLLEP